VYGDRPGWPCTGERERDDPEFVSSRTRYLWGIAPLGVGLTGRGERDVPPLLSLAYHRERYMTCRPPPPPGRYRGLLPPPQGCGQCVAICQRKAVHVGNRFFSGIFATWGNLGPGDENLNHISATVSLENRKHGGVGGRTPCLSQECSLLRKVPALIGPRLATIVTFIAGTPAGVPPDPLLLHAAPGLAVLPVPLDHGAYNDVRVEKMVGDHD